MNALHLYRLFFQAVLRNNSPTRIANDSVEHAVVLIEELIDSAKMTVDVFCHQLALDVWGRESVKAAVMRAAARGINFRVVVQVRDDNVVGQSAFAPMQAQVLKYENDQLRSNFIIVDRKSFRFEKDYLERKGFAYANNPALSGRLINAFEAICQMASR